MGDKTLEELKGDIANYQEQLLGYYTKEDELLVSVFHFIVSIQQPSLAEAILRLHLSLMKL